MHNNHFFEATFVKHPMRTGLEVVVNVNGTTVKVTDLELSERGLIEKVKGEIDKVAIPSSEVQTS